jgi:hypothetical protein
VKKIFVVKVRLSIEFNDEIVKTKDFVSMEKQILIKL